MKIARLMQDKKETYGIVKDDHVATKESITYETGIPLPPYIKDFLFDGWYDEIKDKISNTSFQDRLEKFRLLEPIPNPSKIICLTFNYPNHAKEQNLTSTEDPVIFFKPRTALCGTGSNIICPSFVKQLDYEIELAIIIGKTCKNVAEDKSIDCIFGYKSMFNLYTLASNVSHSSNSIILFASFQLAQNSTTTSPRAVALSKFSSVKSLT